MTPTQRTLQECRRLGWGVDIVERRTGNPWKRPVTKDLFGFADLLAIDPDNCQPFLFIQATSGDNGASRVAKILAECRAKEVIRVGGRVEVWAWRELKKREPTPWGTLASWRPRITPVTLEMFDG